MLQGWSRSSPFRRATSSFREIQEERNALEAAGQFNWIKNWNSHHGRNFQFQWWMKKEASHSSRRKKLGHTQQQGKGIWTRFWKRRNRMRQCQCIWPTNWEIGLVTPLRDSLSGKADATNSIRPLGRITRDAHAQERPIQTRDSRESIELLTIRQIGDIGLVQVFHLLKKTIS